MTTPVNTGAGEADSSFDGRFIIGGERRSSTSRYVLRDPYRREDIAEIATADAEAVDEAVTMARRAQRSVAAMPVHRRAAVLRRAAQLLPKRSEAIAKTISRQTGKALRDARREVDRGRFTLEAAASAIEELSGEIIPADAIPGGESLIALVMREPVGVVAAITPFNAPFNLMVHKVAPSFAAGNTTVVKAPSQAPVTGFQLAELLFDAGMPAEALSVLAGGADTGAALVAHQEVDVVAFTGSRSVGEAIARTAGAKRVLLELGGNSPNLIHDDADLDWAAEAVVRGAYSNNGQSCNSVQRILVHRAVLEDVSQRIRKHMARLIVGDPLSDRTDVGSMIDEGAAARLESWTNEAVAGGAKVLAGGSRQYATFQPTLLRDVEASMRVVCEEAFGPIAVLIPYERVDQAISIANGTAYGLQAAVFTRSLATVFQVVAGLRAGGIMVNRSSNTRIDNLPFGGMKGSGSSREGGRFTVEEMTHRKLVLIDPRLPAV